jgi:hypothetical protein
MTRKNFSIDQLSTATSRRAQSDAAFLQSDLKKLRTSISNMGRMPRHPVVRSTRKKTKKTTSVPSVFGVSLDSIGNIATDSFLLGETGLSSATQQAGRTLALLIQGQRIR